MSQAGATPPEGGRRLRSGHVIGEGGSAASVWALADAQRRHRGQARLTSSAKKPGSKCAKDGWALAEYSNGSEASASLAGALLASEVTLSMYEVSFDREVAARLQRQHEARLSGLGAGFVEGALRHQ